MTKTTTQLSESERVREFHIKLDYGYEVRSFKASRQEAIARADKLQQAEPDRDIKIYYQTEYPMFDKQYVDWGN